MTADLQECNGVVEGHGVQSGQVEVQTVNNLSVAKQCEPKLDNGQIKLDNGQINSGDHAPEPSEEEHEAHGPENGEKGHDLESVKSETKEVDGELVENGETALDEQDTFDVDPELESSNKQDQEPELQCLTNEVSGVETESRNNEEAESSLQVPIEGDHQDEVTSVKNEGREHNLQVTIDREDHKVGSHDLVIKDDGHHEQVLEKGADQTHKVESQCSIDDNLEHESLVVPTEELKPESIPVIDGDCKTEVPGIADLNSAESQSESHTVNEKIEDLENQDAFDHVIRESLEREDDASDHVTSENLENNDDTVDHVVSESLENKDDTSENIIRENRESKDDSSDHVVSETREFEPQYLINKDKGPELPFAVDKSIDFESHTVVSEENEVELQCLPNGSSELESHLDVSDEKGLESQGLVSGNSGLLGEDTHEGKVEVCDGKDEVSDLESGSCNESNSDEISGALGEKSGLCNGTNLSQVQEDIADGADCVATVVLDAANETSGPPILENEQRPEAEAPKKKFCCLVKIPRHTDNKIKAQIRIAQLELDEKTERRDFIRAALQMKRASRQETLSSLKAARHEEKAIREAIRSKKQEMDPVQLTLNKMKNANSVEEYDEKIYQMQYRIEHASIPLREEKQLLREIKQLKISRDELSASAGPHAELQEAFDHIDRIQERSKFLGQELESLKKQVFQAEKNTQAIEKDYNAVNDALSQLQSQWSDADAVRQEAYEALRILKKKEYERNNEFYRNKGDIQAAKQFNLAGDREALDKLCNNQVERIIEMWNKNAEFRKEYIKDNERSTLRRLETLDGRSLGPDEEPPLPTNYGADFDSSLLTQGKSSASGIRPMKEDKLTSNMQDKSTTTMQQSTATMEQSKEVEAKPKRKQSPPPSKALAVPPKKSKGKSKTSSDLIPKIESFEVSSEFVKKEEEDLAKKEEEAAKMKEARRLEEMKKAKEAEERKRRLAERANAKALARAQKEADRKEKEKQKRANKRAAAAAAATGATATTSNISGNDITSSEMQNDALRDFKASSVLEATESRSITQKSAAPQGKKLVSQKVKPIFPTAKKGRKGIQTWMWVLLAVVLCLFPLILWFSF